MLIDITPLKIYRDYRLLFFGQTISFLGSMVSYVAIPYQVFKISQSTFYVGLVSIVQLVPVVLFGLLGGSAADRFNRRTLLLVSEVVMSVAALLLALNSTLESPNLIAVFVFTFIMQGASAYHRPTLEAMSQKMVRPEHFAAMGALRSFGGTFGMIVGPALGGWIIAQYGVSTAYLFDFLSFFVAMTTVLMYSQSYAADRDTANKTKVAEDIKDGFKFAVVSPAILGTYVVDIVAMTFAFPYALFPALAARWGDEKLLGWLYSAGAIGAMLATLFSGWANQVKVRGRMVCLAAGAWGLSIVGFGFVESFAWSFAFLVLAGATDMVSALYRSIIWNETIPNHMRGRLGGLEMISYMTGPLLGNFRAGAMADYLGLNFSILSGGIVCVIGVTITAWWLRAFWNYRPA